MPNIIEKFFPALFRKQHPSTVETTVIDTVQSVPVNELSNILYYSAQSIGKVRAQNEDSVFAASFNLAGNGQILQLGLFIIADGMGGHHHGEIASSIAISTISGEILEKLAVPLCSSHHGETPNLSLHELLAHAIKQAQSVVLSTVPGAGTTVTLGVILNNEVTLAQVGDSRCYLLKQDGIFQSLTTDHSLVNQWVQLGQITKAEAENHPQKNILYKAIGQKGEVEADIETIPLQAGDLLLFCSDGLWGQFTEQDLHQALSGDGDLATMGESLVRDANNSGGPDNISLILVKLT